MTITEQLAGALLRLGEQADRECSSWSYEMHEAMENAAAVLAAYEASKAEEDRMDCYQYGKVPTLVRERLLITVCSSCLRASCWHGRFYCSDYKSAGTVQKTIAELRELNREHPSHWEPHDNP